MKAVITLLALLWTNSPVLEAQKAVIDPARNAIDPGARASQIDTLRVSGPEHVRDTCLRNGKFWGRWNYGNAPYLQVGAQPSTVYDTYRSVSLIRFDLSGLQAMRVDSAKLRLYVPRNQTQQVPIPLHVHLISAANAGWREGSSEAEEEFAASSWNHRGNGEAWAGAPGLAKAGVDYEAAPLDTKIAEGLTGEWVEFKLPAGLVQSWMENPRGNTGLLVRTDDDAPLGESTHICSSQHWSGNGPQLVIKGKFSMKKVGVGAVAEKINPRMTLPPTGPLFRRWLDESDDSRDRYPLWARDKNLHLSDEQIVYPYLWDIFVKANMLIPKATLPLSKITEEIPGTIARGDKARARQIMDDCMKYLMVYDYGRDQVWYDSGPTVDVLSPLQIARLFVKGADDGGGKGARGIYSQYGFERREKSSPEEIENEIKSQVAEIKQQLNPNPAQYSAIERMVRYNLPLEHRYRDDLKQGLERVQKLIAAQDDGVEMLKALRAMFFNHRMFLIHQSLFSMPKYSVLLDNGDILRYAQWFYNKRVGQYNHERVGRQLAVATRYMWKPSPFQEAEYAAFKGCDWCDKSPGFTGTGYIVMGDRPDSHVEWDTEIADAGKCNLVFRYMLASTNDVRLRLSIFGNSAAEALSFSPTDAGIWASRSIAVTLPAGPAKIRLTAMGGEGLCLDHLDIQPCVPEGIEKSSRRSSSGIEKPALARSSAE